MIEFRPHHFMCTLSFQGLGYSPEFTANYWKILQHLVDDPETLIQVTFSTDSICAPCPHRTIVGKCEHQGKIERLDNAHAEILGLQNGQRLSWKQAKQLIKERMSLDSFHRACHTCQWKSLGICETALCELYAQEEHQT